MLTVPLVLYRTTVVARQGACPEHSPPEVACDLVTCSFSPCWPAPSPPPLASGLLRRSRAACFSTLQAGPSALSFLSCPLAPLPASPFLRAFLSFFLLLLFSLPSVTAALSFEPPLVTRCLTPLWSLWRGLPHQKLEEVFLFLPFQNQVVRFRGPLIRPYSLSLLALAC